MLNPRRPDIAGFVFIQDDVALQMQIVAQQCEQELRLAGAAGVERLSVRLGLNAGEPVSEEGDLFGTAVQLAARICAQAEPGQVLVSNVVRELTAGRSFLFADAGEAALRGFDAPVRLYAVGWQP